MIDLFRAAQLQERLRVLQGTQEWRVMEQVARACMLERATEPVWSWAERHVFLDEKMTAEPGYYDSGKTPWAREWQELPLRGDVRVVGIKKSSRSGGSEAAFNILRWMPQHWPGNAGVVFPDDKQARDVAKRRLLDSITKHASAQLSGDKDDTTLSNIHLLNMVIKVGPSGSPRLFTEWWVRFFILDEIEEHDTDDTTTTFDRALSRQNDVADAILFAISKPKRANGIINKVYIQGSQKQWHTPCPRCERGFVLNRHCFHNEPECRRSDGTWDLEQVIKPRATFALCPLCGGRIDEFEKRMMNDAALWVPSAEEHRLRDADGNYVPPLPGWETYQISDYVSYHPKVTWGELRAMKLMAFDIQPTTKAQVHYINNHEGEAEEKKVIQVDAKSIEALQAGRVESRRIQGPDGVDIEQNVVLGIPGGYRLAYRRGQFNAALPYHPDFLLLFADKQQSYFKYLVFAVRIDLNLPGMCEAHLVDLGREDDETTLKENVVKRVYHVQGSEEKARITAGFVDARYRGKRVYEFCLECYHELGVSIWPVRGEGEEIKKERRKADEGEERRTRETLRGRILRFVKDWCERGELFVRYFKDHPLKTDFYLDKIQKREGWRIWLPLDYPKELASEWTAEVYDEDADVFIHNKQKRGPNDYGDCGKYLVLWLMEHLPAILAQRGHAMVPEVSPEVEQAPESGRDYVVKPRENDG